MTENNFKQSSLGIEGITILSNTNTTDFDFFFRQSSLFLSGNALCFQSWVQLESQVSE